MLFGLDAFRLATCYLSAGYQMAVGQLFTGNQLAISWQQFGNWLAISYLSSIYQLTIGWVWLAISYALAGYGLAIVWVWVCYGMAMGYQSAGHQLEISGLAMDWLWAIYQLALCWLWNEYGLAMDKNQTFHFRMTDILNFYINKLNMYRNTSMRTKSPALIVNLCSGFFFPMMT